MKPRINDIEKVLGGMKKEERSVVTLAIISNVKERHELK